MFIKVARQYTLASREASMYHTHSNKMLNPETTGIIKYFPLEKQKVLHNNYLFPAKFCILCILMKRHWTHQEDDIFANIA